MRPVMPRWTLSDILWPWGRIRRLRAALAQAIADNECLRAVRQVAGEGGEVRKKSCVGGLRVTGNAGTVHSIDNATGAAK